MIFFDAESSSIVSDYICLSCSNIRLIADPKEENTFICPSCGKIYYPKMHTMRIDPTTTISNRLNTVATIQKGIVSMDDRVYLTNQVASTTAMPNNTDKKNDYSPLIRRITKTTDAANFKHMPRTRKNVRTTSYMKNEGSIFKEKHYPQEVLNMGAEIVSFKETIE